MHSRFGLGCSSFSSSSMRSSYSMPASFISAIFWLLSLASCFGDGFGADVFLGHPVVLVGESIEGRINALAVWLGVFKFLQLLNALVVFDAGQFHLRHFLAFELGQLFRRWIWGGCFPGPPSGACRRKH